ncbi:MAG: hypothetical protein QOF59_835 [Actinomycetota bacterium]|jgi:hypothetical protein|nr:hypothetical protein [Actinomycetota bacterium]MDQ1475204.1 hypothetical protein [Actinomycetota bacterium]
MGHAANSPFDLPEFPIRIRGDEIRDTGDGELLPG